ncbi:TIR-only protein-like [Macadamia integrifolia]|uniref:TIR-only protein-like n=1 Tax=Macadamia integrifolia TaxID=60698 RepID=UPI001C530847|nr:TIR-only protein-like [Macadamia integrifolia]
MVRGEITVERVSLSVRFSIKVWSEKGKVMAEHANDLGSAGESPPPFDVFINHRGVDTKRNIAALLFERLDHLKRRPFLDYKSMTPGEEIEEVIETAIRDCKVGVAIFSPNYCSSDNCLHELALLMEYKKKVIPIFYDVKTSDLMLVDDGNFPAKQLHRFSVALELAKGTVGISFDSCKGDWSDMLKRVSDRVVEILKDLEDEEKF